MNSDKGNGELRNNYIVVGDICVFNPSNGENQNFRIGKAIQFIEFSGKQKTKSYKGNYDSVSSNCGVMCTWFTNTNNEEKNKFQMMPTSDMTYHHVNSYLCTLTNAASIVNGVEENAVRDFGFISTSLSIGNAFEITEETLQHITSLINATKTNTEAVVDLTMTNNIHEDTDVPSIPEWVTCGTITLSQKDKTILRQNNLKQWS